MSSLVTSFLQVVATENGIIEGLILIDISLLVQSVLNVFFVNILLNSIPFVIPSQKVSFLLRYYLLKLELLFRRSW